MKIYLTRHGQTQWNKEKRFQGTMDSPLTEKGIADAKKLGIYLEKIPLDRIVVSPLKRAKDTANLIIGTRKIPIEVDGRLSEMNMGVWEGKDLIEVQRDYPQTYQMYWENIERFSVPGGENFKDLYKRCDAFIYDLLEGKEDSLLIVSHGMTLAFLMEILRGKQMWEMDTPVHIVKGASLTLFEVVNHQIRQIFLEKRVY